MDFYPTRHVSLHARRYRCGDAHLSVVSGRLDVRNASGTRFYESSPTIDNREGKRERERERESCSRPTIANLAVLDRSTRSDVSRQHERGGICGIESRYAAKIAVDRDAGYRDDEMHVEPHLTCNWFTDDE